MHDAAESIAKDLDLDMPRPFQITFDIEAAIAEVSLTFTARLRDRILQQIEIANNAHALAAAARRGLDEQWRSDRPRPCEKCRRITFLDGGGRNRKAISLDEIACADLITHQLDYLRRWADKGNA